MPAVAYKQWRDEGGSERPEGNRIVRDITIPYLVVDAATQDEAYNAVGLPRINQEFAPGSPLRVRSRTPSRAEGPRSWKFAITYGISQNGTFPSEQLDLLQRPAVVSWGEQIVQRVREVDGKGRLIRNSAGQFPSQLPTQNIYVETLTITKYFPFYDRAMARKFRNTVNSNEFTLGSTQILPGECYCRSVIPVAPYEAIESAIVQVGFFFELDIESRSPTQEPDVSGDPFDYHIADRGSRAWYLGSDNKPKLGFICAIDTTVSQPFVLSMVEDVPLDGKGKPIDTTLRVYTSPTIGLGEIKEAIDSPNSNDDKVHLDDPYKSPFDTPKLRMFRYFNCRRVDYSTLPI
jgi:hypothetical protein